MCEYKLKEMEYKSKVYITFGYYIFIKDLIQK